MNLLLDTHIWLWSLTEPRRLTAQVKQAIIHETSELWLSPISVWEFLLLAERGRIRVHGSIAPSAWVDSALTLVPMRDAPLTREVALRSREVGVDHDDPADRFLAATAHVYDLTLVTGDERLLRGEGFRTLANR